MSLLRWKELAKSKSELGNKINYVHNAITQHKIGEQTNQESFACFVHDGEDEFGLCLTHTTQ